MAGLAENNRKKKQQALQPENDASDEVQVGNKAPMVSSEEQKPEGDEPEGDEPENQSEKYPFGAGVYTNDKGLINEYLQLARKHFGKDIAKHSIVEQLNILFNRVNKFVAVLQKLKEGGWRGCAYWVNIACNNYLADGTYSKKEKKKVSDVNVFLIDLMFMLVESRIPLSVVCSNYLHHQRQLSRILRKKPETLTPEELENFDIDLLDLDLKN